MKLKFRVLRNRNGMHKAQIRKSLRWKDLYIPVPGNMQFKRVYGSFDTVLDMIDEYVELLQFESRSKQWRLRALPERTID